MPKKTEKTDKKIKSSGKGERFADMSATAVVIKEPSLEELKTQPVEKAKKPKKAKVRGKNYLAAKKQIEPTKLYSPEQAFELLKKVSLTKFDGSVETHLNVATKGLSGEIIFPHFKGKARKVAIFDEALGKKIKEGEIDFDLLLASPADMPKILPLAKILGPKGLIPNPKTGTLTADPKKAAEKFSSGSTWYKTEKDFPLIHLTIGKVNQPVDELTANFQALIKTVDPKNIKKAVIKSTISPAIKMKFA